MAKNKRLGGLCEQKYKYILKYVQDRLVEKDGSL